MDKKYSNGSAGKVRVFLKKNMYYILIVLSVLAVIAMITVAAVLGSKTPAVDPPTQIVPEDPDPPVIENPDDKNPEAEKPDPEKPVVVDPFILTMPVANATSLLPYDEENPVWHESGHFFAVHEGIDFKADEGAAVLAAFGGTVVNVISDNPTTGAVIVISHKDGFTTTYKMLDSAVLVNIGDTVSAGQQIGKVAKVPLNVEGVKEVHLHFELAQNGTPINPTMYFPEGDK